MKCRRQLNISWKISIANEYIFCRYEWHHPIVLIGHSFGGLVLKSLVVKLNRESTIRNPTNSWSKATVQCAKVFLRNVRGVAFYAVPHAGSSNFAEYVNKLLKCNNGHDSGIMDNIQPWQRDMEWFSGFWCHCQWKWNQYLCFLWGQTNECGTYALDEMDFLQPVTLWCCSVLKCVIWVLWLV